MPDEHERREQNERYRVTRTHTYQQTRDEWSERECAQRSDSCADRHERDAALKDHAEHVGSLSSERNANTYFPSPRLHSVGNYAVQTDHGKRKRDCRKNAAQDRGDSWQE